MSEHDDAYYQRHFADRQPISRRREAFLHPPVEQAEFWCSKCDQPATATIALTLGESRAYCSTHAWPLINRPKAPAQAGPGAGPDVRCPDCRSPMTPRGCINADCGRWQGPR